MADTKDLGSFAARRVGSSPSPCTTFELKSTFWSAFLYRPAKFSHSIKNHLRKKKPAIKCFRKVSERTFWNCKIESESDRICRIAQRYSGYSWAWKCSSRDWTFMAESQRIVCKSRWCSKIAPGNSRKSELQSCGKHEKSSFKKRSILLKTNCFT